VFGKLDAKLITPSDRMDVFSLARGSNLGLEYVPDSEALTPSQMRIAPWIEILVEDAVAARERLLGLGLEQIEYRDKDHAYFVGPGGFIFRVRSATEAS
jgi:hypothetical protein